MNKIDKKIYLERYNKRLEEFAHSPKTLGWSNDKEKQFLRFKIALESLRFSSKPIKSVLDIGCGFGDMGGEFMKNNYPNVRYTGIDINENLINEGKKLFPSLDLRVGNILEMNIEKYDLVCASGVFNYAMKRENQIEYMRELVNRFYQLSTNLVSIDFLSTYVDFKHEGSYHTEIENIFDIAKKLSKRVVVRNDYLDFEYCVYIIKNELA
jgi:ubiquinone/menaquinone biosynthesis C-methylase UbiE